MSLFVLQAALEGQHRAHICNICDCEKNQNDVPNAFCIRHTKAES